MKVLNTVDVKQSTCHPSFRTRLCRVFHVISRVDSSCCAKHPPSYDPLMCLIDVQFSRRPLLTCCNYFWQTDLLNYTSRDRYNFGSSACRRVFLLGCCHVVMPRFRFLWRFFSIGPQHLDYPKYMILYWCMSDYKACFWSGLAVDLFFVLLMWRSCFFFSLFSKGVL